MTPELATTETAADSPARVRSGASFRYRAGAAVQLRDLWARVPPVLPRAQTASPTWSGMVDHGRFAALLRDGFVRRSPAATVSYVAHAHTADGPDAAL